jgi:outer membrane protein, heavy metal efflux system
MQSLLRPIFYGYSCLRNSIQQLCIPLLFISLLSTASTAAELKESASKLTLDNALNLALTANPDIAVAMREREAVEGIKTQAGIRLNPTLSTFVQDTRSANRQTTLQISQELELGNKRDARLAAAALFYDKSAIEIESKKAEIHANVVATFYEVLAAQERLILAKSSLEVANLALDAATKRIKAGKSSPVEETKSRIAESTAKIEVNQALSQLNVSRKRLSALWGGASLQFESVEGQVINIAKTATLTELSAMLEQAPAIKLAKLEIDARDALTTVERSKSIPNITVSAGVVNNQELGGINQALLGLSIPIPLFDKNQGNVQEALSRKYKAEDALVALKNQLLANLASQYERLSSARLAAESLRSEILPSSQSSFDAANKGFAAGKFNFLDVLDAQRTLFQAKSQYVQALLEAHQSVAEIERILGDVISHQSSEIQE